jgi:3-methyladenine DNA glycosylase/8-oxoguanine DNA glycosylase
VSLSTEIAPPFEIKTTLRTTAPFDFGLTADVLSRLPAYNTIERWDALAQQHTRALETRQGPQLVTARAAPQGLHLNNDTPEAEDWARRSFGLACDPTEFYEMAARDPVLRQCVIALHGLRPPLLEPWEAWIAAILGQQITLSFCLQTIGYVAKRYAGDVGGHSLHPTPEAILEATVEDLRICKVSRQKAAYLKVAAQATLDGYCEGLLDVPLEQAIAHLTALKGVGRWTARYWLATVGRMDSLAYGDAGLISAFKRAYGENHDLEAWGENLGAVRGWAYWYLIWGVKYAANRMTS